MREIILKNNFMKDYKRAIKFALLVFLFLFLIRF